MSHFSWKYTNLMRCGKNIYNIVTGISIAGVAERAHVILMAPWENLHSMYKKYFQVTFWVLQFVRNGELSSP